MFKRILILLAGTAAVLSFAASSSAQPAPPHAGARTSCVLANYCGYLNDDNGAGYAASPRPGQGDIGDGVYSIGDDGGAWRVQVYRNTLFCGNAGKVTSNCPYAGNGAAQNGLQKGNLIVQLALAVSTNVCFRTNGTSVELATCNESLRDQMWVVKGCLCAGGYLFNVATTDANSFGNPQPLSNPGPGRQLVTCNLNCTSLGRQTWTVNAGTKAGGNIQAVAVVRGCSIDVPVTHGTNTTNARIVNGCGERVRAWEMFAGSSAPQDGPWKYTGTSTAWRNTGTVPYTGGYQRMTRAGTVHTITTY